MRRAVLLPVVAVLVTSCGGLLPDFQEPPRATLASTWEVAGDGTATVRSVYALTPGEDTRELEVELPYSTDTDFHEIGARRVGAEVVGTRQDLTWTDVAVTLTGDGAPAASTEVREVVLTPTVTVTLDGPLTAPAELVLTARVAGVALPDGRQVLWVHGGGSIAVDSAEVTVTTPTGSPTLDCLQSGYDEDEVVARCDGGVGTATAVPGAGISRVESMRVVTTS